MKPLHSGRALNSCTYCSMIHERSSKRGSLPPIACGLDENSLFVRKCDFTNSAESSRIEVMQEPKFSKRCSVESLTWCCRCAAQALPGLCANLPANRHAPEH